MLLPIVTQAETLLALSFRRLYCSKPRKGFENFYPKGKQQRKASDKGEHPQTLVTFQSAEQLFLCSQEPLLQESLRAQIQMAAKQPRSSRAFSR